MAEDEQITTLITKKPEATRNISNQIPSPTVDQVEKDHQKNSVGTLDSDTSITASDEVEATSAPSKAVRIDKDYSLHVTSEMLKDYIGPPVHRKDRLYVNAPPAGVSTGLGFTGNGSGCTMAVEASVCHKF